MRVQLIHGGLWDGWCVVELDNGERRLVRSISDDTFEHIERTAALTDITRAPAGSRHVGPAADLELRAAHLTVLPGGA